MIEDIKKRLEAGEVVELECVDIKAISTSNKSYAEALLSEPLIVSHIFANKIIFKSQLFIYEAELQYFRIKEKAKNAVGITSHTHTGVTSGSETTTPESNPAFDDLIDVAVKAVKDRVLSGVELERDGVESLRYWTDKRSDCNVIFAQHNNYQDGIDFINSLYTETFVIESDIDILKLKGEPKITLSNGNEFVATDMNILSNSRGMHAICFIDIDSYEMVYSFFELKGATVTQKRGKQ